MASSPRPCVGCGRHLPRKAHPNKRYCEQCRPSKPRKAEPERVGATVLELLPSLAANGPVDTEADEPAEPLGPISAATEKAIEAADHLTSKDDGAVQVLRYLAKKLDTEDQLRDKILHAQLAAGEKPQPPPFDNTSMPTYLNFANALGLTPAGRRILPSQNQQGSSKKARLAQMRESQTGR